MSHSLKSSIGHPNPTDVETDSLLHEREGGHGEEGCEYKNLKLPIDFNEGQDRLLLA